MKSATATAPAAAAPKRAKAATSTRAKTAAKPAKAKAVARTAKKTRVPATTRLKAKIVKIKDKATKRFNTLKTTSAKRLTSVRTKLGNKIKALRTAGTAARKENKALKRDIRAHGRISAKALKVGAKLAKAASRAVSSYNTARVKLG